MIAKGMSGQVALVGGRVMGSVDGNEHAPALPDGHRWRVVEIEPTSDKGAEWAWVELGQERIKINPTISLYRLWDCLLLVALRGREIPQAKVEQQLQALQVGLGAVGQEEQFYIWRSPSETVFCDTRDRFAQYSPQFN